jgi:hypothetical protein
MAIRRIIQTLNTLSVGELDRVLGQLDEARAELRDREDLSEIAIALQEARDAITSGDLKTYRKRIEKAVSRLGHAQQ